jgi:hypothetical protein
MSTEEKSFLKKWLFAVSSVLFAQCAGIIWMGVTDHFQLQTVAEDMAIIKPRVDQLWYEKPHAPPQ